MKLVAKTIQRNGQFSFDIVDLSDYTVIGGQEIPESLYTSGDYANEATADRNGVKVLEQFRKASDQEFRRFCGYDAQPRR